MSATDTATLVAFLHESAVVAASLGDTLTAERNEDSATRLSELQAEVERLNEAEAESLGVIDILSRRLAEVCIALKGEPPPNVRWSYHDLGELCAALKTEVSRLDTDAMHLDAEREYWWREAKGLRLANADLRHKLGQCRKRARKVREERDALRRRIREAGRMHIDGVLVAFVAITLSDLSPGESELENPNG